ncbi:MAG: glycosyltransferase 36, partial [Asticcacaulis sp.]
MTAASPLIAFDDQACRLFSPTALPRASGFLWNRKMMLHITARGFATAQFMQPEPAKYAHAPNLEAKTFMQPEQPYYAHHPGRFFYVRDRDNGALFSAPHEPVRKAPEQFEFTQYPERMAWRVHHNGVDIRLTLTLPVDEACELWAVELRNTGNAPRQLSLCPYFPFGYMSWMNQSARFDAKLNTIIASSIT